MGDVSKLFRVEHMREGPNYCGDHSQVLSLAHQAAAAGDEHRCVHEVCTFYRWRSLGQR